MELHWVLYVAPLNASNKLFGIQNRAKRVPRPLRWQQCHRIREHRYWQSPRRGAYSQCGWRPLILSAASSCLPNHVSSGGTAVVSRVTRKYMHESSFSGQTAITAQRFGKRNTLIFDWWEQGSKEEGVFFSTFSCLLS